MAHKIGTLRVYHFQQVPGTPKRYLVKDAEAGEKLIRSLIESDLEDDSITFNTLGMEVFDESTGKLDWSEWYNEEGEDILEVIDRKDEEDEA